MSKVVFLATDVTIAGRTSPVDSPSTSSFSGALLPSVIIEGEVRGKDFLFKELGAGRHCQRQTSRRNSGPDKNAPGLLIAVNRLSGVCELVRLRAWRGVAWPGLAGLSVEQWKFGINN